MFVANLYSKYDIFIFTFQIIIIRFAEKMVIQNHITMKPADKVDMNVKILLIGDSNVGKSW